jgi:1-phosphatidylinositol-4-phosphate 5-kinase
MFNANFKTLAEMCSSGKSGSFFYYTSDAKFILKTVSRHEFKFLKKILREYHLYLTGENPDSLISRILGLHKVIFYRKKGKMSKKLYFTIMNNVFTTNKKIDYRYDLKGST